MRKECLEVGPSQSRSLQQTRTGPQQAMRTPEEPGHAHARDVALCSTHDSPAMASRIDQEDAGLPRRSHAQTLCADKAKILSSHCMLRSGSLLHQQCMHSPCPDQCRFLTSHWSCPAGTGPHMRPLCSNMTAATSAPIPNCQSAGYPHAALSLASRQTAGWQGARAATLSSLRAYVSA